jgi:urate oxidase
VKLAAHRYGKNRVRLVKVLRDGDVHTVKELTARVMFEGAFDRSFTDGDNNSVVATDTMKNTIHVLAHEHLGIENEPFARHVVEHFLSRYTDISRVILELDERVWTRLRIKGADHPHCFVHGQVGRPFTRLSASREETVHESGMRDLTILKSAGSGFEGFQRDSFTTLAETRDRILATSAHVSWRRRRTPASHLAASARILEALLVPFADRYSPSLQGTLYEMATAAIDACPEIDRVTLRMPNLHCLLVDLTPFGRINQQELFLPTDEPHGCVEATVSR